MELGIKKLNAGSIVFGLIALAVIGFITADIVIKFQGLYLILFSFAYVLFPGFMLLVSLGQDFLSRYKKWLFLFSFYAGFALLVIEYFLLNLIGFLPAIKVLPVLLGIGLAALSWKRIRAFNYNKILSYDLKKAVPYLFLLAAVMAFSYYYLLKTAPSVNSNLFMDFCYHMGNVETLTRGGSFEDIRVMGMTFKYHYFMELYYASIRNVFPAEIWNCVFRYPVLLMSPLISGSIYKLIRTRSENRIICALVTALMILFPSIDPASSLLTNHVLTNINAVGVALPPAVCLVEMILRSADKKGFKYKDLIVIFLLCFVLTGLKGPFAMAVIAATVVYMIYCSVTKRDVLTNQLSVFLVLIAAFAILWFTLLNAAITGSNISGPSTGIFRVFDFQVYVPQIVNWQANTYSSAQGLLYIPLNLIIFFGGAALPFLAMIVVLITGIILKNETKRDYRLFMCAFCAVTGIVFDYVLAVAQNRVYFFMFATPFVYLCAFEYIKIIKVRKKAIQIIAGLIAAISLGFSVISAVNAFRKPFFDTPRGVLTQGELDSIAWIKNNTDKDALFAINTDYPNGNPYFYSGMSERRYYLESYRYSQNSGKTINDLSEQAKINAQMFNDDNSPEICSRIGVEYLVWFNEGGSTEVLDKNYKLCFSSEDVRIYSVK